MNATIVKKAKRTRRHGRVRAKISGTSTRPRLSVFKSNRYIYAQLIDDEKGVTLATANTMKNTRKTTMLENATEVGTSIATQAKTKKITEAIFDRGGFLYAGRIKAVADAARKGGLQF